ncbi:unnamed protein product [Caenorhabditis brenneri]
MATPSTNPLSYDPLKRLLQYLDPNIRFKLARRCPSIRSLEKTIPLTIDTLKFDETAVTVNNTRYHLDLAVIYDVPNVMYDDVPNVVKFVTHDVDSYGELKDFSHVMKPGDIDLRTDAERQERDRQREEERIRREEQRIHDEAFEGRLELMGWEARRLQEQEELDDSEETRNEIRELRMEHGRLRRQHDRERRNRARRNRPRGNGRRVQTDTEYINLVQMDETRMRHHREEARRIRPHDSDRMFLQLIDESNDPFYFEEMHYRGFTKLYKAVKYFNEKLFGGRTDVRVKKFVLEKYGIFRFPRNFNVKVFKEMEFAGTFDFERLNHVIAPDNYATTTVTINVKENDERNWEQHAIRTAKMLKIQDHTSDNTDFLQGLENKNVMFFQKNHTYPVNDLIRHWRRNGKPVGTKYTIGHSYLKAVQKSLNSVKHTFKVERNQRRALVLSMKKWNTQLKVYWERALPVREDNDFPYLLIVKVEDAS